VACAVYAAQLAGSVVLIIAGGSNVPLLMLGVVLFGAGFGNATSLPPLIAQVELVEGDVQRAVALMVGISQGAYAFAPVIFGLLGGSGLGGGAVEAGTHVYMLAALVQALAIAAFLAGRRDPAYRAQSNL